MKITSGVFEEGGFIPEKYTCDGANVNPPLSIHDIPQKTKSLVLIMEDPDVPRHLRKDGMYDHWVVFNIPPNTKEISEGREPAGTHGIGTGGQANYFGPCPPDGQHRYFFKLYALDALLSLPEKSTKQDVLNAMQGHILAEGKLMGVYGRTKK